MDVEKWVGATRPLVTLILILTLCYIVVINVDPKGVDFKDFQNLVMIVALFWFKSRDEEKRQTEVTDSANQKVAEKVIAKIEEIKKEEKV